MSTASASSLPLLHLNIVPQVESLAKESDEKEEKDLPFSLALSELQQQILPTITTKKYPLNPKYSTWETDKGIISPPILLFSTLELCDQLNVELRKLFVPWDEKMFPYIIGGAAAYLMGGPDYADVDLCYYINRADFKSILEAITETIRVIAKASHGIELSSRDIKELYLHRKKLIKEPGDLSAFYGLGGIEIKFIYTKFRQNVSTADSFLVELYTPIVRCVKLGGGWGNAEDFHAALEDLSQRRFVVKSPQTTVGLIYRMVHKLTQGFSVDQTTRDVALAQLKAHLKKHGPEAFAQEIDRHIHNHYGTAYGSYAMPKFLDLLNFLSIFNALPPKVMESSESAAERHFYVQILVQAWMKSAPELEKVFASWALLLHSHRDMGTHFLPFMRGMFLCQWIKKQGNLEAYTHPHPEAHQKPEMPASSGKMGHSFTGSSLGIPTELTQMAGKKPSMHLSMAHEKSVHYLYLEHSPDKIAIDFMLSWDALHKLCSSERDRAELCSLMRTLNCFPFNKKGHEKAFKLLCEGFDSPPLASLWKGQFKNLGCARAFYAFAIEYAAKTPFPKLEDLHIPLKLATYRLSHHLAELKKLGDHKTYALVKGLIACLRSFADEKSYSEQCAKTALALKAASADHFKEERKEADEKLAKLRTSATNLSADTEQVLDWLLQRSVQRGNFAALPLLFQFYTILDGLDIFSKTSQQRLLIYFMQAVVMADTFPTWAQALLKNVDDCDIFKARPEVAVQLTLLSFLQKISHSAPPPFHCAHKFLTLMLSWVGESSLCPQSFLNISLALMRRFVESSAAQPAKQIGESASEHVDRLDPPSISTLNSHRSLLFHTFQLFNTHSSLLTNLSTQELHAWHESIYAAALTTAKESGDKEQLRQAYATVEQIVNAHPASSSFMQNLWGTLDALLQPPLKKSGPFFAFLLTHIDHFLSKQKPHADFHPRLLYAIDRICVAAEEPQNKSVKERFQKMVNAIHTALHQSPWQEGALKRALKSMSAVVCERLPFSVFSKTFLEFVDLYAMTAKAEEALKYKDFLEQHKLRLLKPLTSVGKPAKIDDADFHKQRSPILYGLVPLLAQSNISWAQEFLYAIEPVLEKNYLWELTLFLVKKHVEASDKDHLLRAYDLWLDKQTLIVDTHKILTEHQQVTVVSIGKTLLTATFHAEKTLKIHAEKWERTVEIVIHILKKARKSLDSIKDDLKIKMRENVLSALSAILQSEIALNFTCAEKLLAVAVQEKHLSCLEAKKASLAIIHSCNRRLSTSLSPTDMLENTTHAIKYLIALHRAEKTFLEEADLAAVFSACQISTLLVTDLRERGKSAESALFSAQALFIIFLTEKEQAKAAWTNDIILMAKMLIDLLTHFKEEAKNLLALQIARCIVDAPSFKKDVWCETFEALFNKLALTCLVHKKGTPKSISMSDILEKLIEKELLPFFTNQGLVELTTALIASNSTQAQLWEVAWQSLQLSKTRVPKEYAELKIRLLAELGNQIQQTQNPALIQMLYSWHASQSAFDRPLYLQLMKALTILPFTLQAKYFSLITTKLAPSELFKKLFSDEKPPTPRAVCALAQAAAYLFDYMHSLHTSKSDKLLKLPSADFAFKEKQWLTFSLIKEYASPEATLHFPTGLQTALSKSLTHISHTLFQICISLPTPRSFENVVMCIQEGKTSNYKSAFLAALNLFCSLSPQNQLDYDPASLSSLLRTTKNKSLLNIESGELLIIFRFLNILFDQSAKMKRWDMLENAIVIFGQSNFLRMRENALKGQEKAYQKITDSDFLTLLPKVVSKVMYCKVPIKLKQEAMNLIFSSHELLPLEHSYLTLEMLFEIAKPALSAEESLPCEILVTRMKLKGFAAWVFSISMDTSQEVSEAIHNFTLYLSDYARYDKVKGLEILAFIAFRLFEKNPQWTQALSNVLQEAHRVHLFASLPTEEAQNRASYLELHIHLGLFEMLTTHKNISNFRAVLDGFKTLTCILTPYLHREKPLEKIMGLYSIMGVRAMLQVLLNKNSLGLEMLFIFINTCFRAAYEDTLLPTPAPEIVFLNVNLDAIIYQLLFIPSMLYGTKGSVESDHKLRSEPSLSSPEASAVEEEREFLCLQRMASESSTLKKMVEPLISDLPPPIQTCLLETFPQLLSFLDLPAYKKVRSQDASFLCHSMAMLFYIFLRDALVALDKERNILIISLIKNSLSKLPPSSEKTRLLHLFDTKVCQESCNETKEIFERWHLEALSTASMSFRVNSCPSCPDLSPSDFPPCVSSAYSPKGLHNFIADFLSAFPEFETFAKDKEAESKLEVDLKEIHNDSSISLALDALKKVNEKTKSSDKLEAASTSSSSSSSSTPSSFRFGRHFTYVCPNSKIITSTTSCREWGYVNGTH